LGPVTPYLDQIESIIVPDITASGAYDEAVQDVEYIIHVASPTPNPTITDFDRDLNQPARQGTVGILESAYKRSGIKKIVITASAASIISAKDILLGSDGTLFSGRLLSFIH
jgi:nucleoside-diphosphate-sugar epimerase